MAQRKTGETLGPQLLSAILSLHGPFPMKKLDRAASLFKPIRKLGVVAYPQEKGWFSHPYDLLLK